MSPEQAQGEAALDARCDIYAFGCVLYEMLAGEKAFSGVSAQAIFAKQIGEMPRAIRVLRPDVPPPMEAAVRHSLAKRPGERPWMASELVRELEREGYVTTAGDRTVILKQLVRPHELVGLLIW